MYSEDLDLKGLAPDAMTRCPCITKPTEFSQASDDLPSEAQLVVSFVISKACGIRHGLKGLDSMEGAALACIAVARE